MLWKGGSAPIANLHVEGERDLGDLTASGAGELVAAVNTMPAFIELEPAKFTDYLKEEGLSEVIAWRSAHSESGKPGRERYSKFAKSVLLSGPPNGFGQEKVGFTIEIIPEADLYKVKAGEALPVLVLFRGKPAAGLQIETAWAGKGVLFAESGICSAVLAGRDTHPSYWQCYGAVPDEGVQAKYFTSLFEACWGRPWMAGLFVWKWAWQGGPGDPTFFPLNKSAAGVLGANYGAA